MWQKYRRFLHQTTANFLQKFDHNIALEKHYFFRRKLAEIAENCDPNINPGSRVVSLLQTVEEVVWTLAVFKNRPQNRSVPRVVPATAIGALLNEFGICDRGSMLRL
jgi:hypothetical protein